MPIRRSNPIGVDGRGDEGTAGPEIGSDNGADTQGIGLFQCFEYQLEVRVIDQGDLGRLALTASHKVRFMPDRDAVNELSVANAAVDMTRDPASLQQLEESVGLCSEIQPSATQHWQSWHLVPLELQLAEASIQSLGFSRFPAIADPEIYRTIYARWWTTFRGRLLARLRCRFEGGAAPGRTSVVSSGLASSS